MNIIKKGTRTKLFPYATFKAFIMSKEMEKYYDPIHRAHCTFTKRERSLLPWNV